MVFSCAMLVTGVEGLYVWCRRITGGYRGKTGGAFSEHFQLFSYFCDEFIIFCIFQLDGDTGSTL